MRIISDVNRGAWLAGLMHGWAQVGSVAGHGFEAYVRLLHPRPWERGNEEDWSRRRWADIAARRGRVMHPLVQWERLLEVDESRHSSDVGWLDPLVLAELAPLLAAATTTPDDVVAGFWEGGSGQKLRTPAVLELPDRAHVLAQTSLTEVGDPDWGTRCAWAGGTDCGRRRCSCFGPRTTRGYWQPRLTGTRRSLPAVVPSSTRFLPTGASRPSRCVTTTTFPRAGTPSTGRERAR